MNILGYSGLDNSVSFKRRELPGLQDAEYRIGQGFDSAAALVSGGRVRAAAAEERYTGEKATGRFPRQAIADCLRRTGLSARDIDYVAHGFSYEPGALEDADEFSARRFEEVYDPAVQLQLLTGFYPEEDWTGRLVAVPHHLAHAASAYYPSGFEDALVLVADGMGETESLTVAVGSQGKLDVLHRIPALHSLGTLYSVFTHYLGFLIAMDEYKVMGLAPYGDRRRYHDELMTMVRLGENGTFTIPLLARNRNLVERETYRGVLRALIEALGPARPPGAPIEQHHMDIAAGLQATLETCLLHVLSHFRAATGLRDLCFAGGVALNCTANGVIARSRLFDRVFVPPGAGDDGTAVGAALYLQANREPGTEIPRMGMPYWGESFTEAEIGQAVTAADGVSARRVDDFDEIVTEVAGHVEAGRVVAWFQGGMEFGPRALGNRSIIADPRDARMRDHINGLIKQREDFRPFAPIVTEEDAAEYFEIRPGTEKQYAHMLFTTRTRAHHRLHLGAVTHVDGSARVQVVSRDGNPRMWALLNAFKARTGMPVLLNTSFNLRGQPIVRTPEIAVDTFLRGGLDYLVIGNHILAPSSGIGPLS